MDSLRLNLSRLLVPQALAPNLPLAFALLVRAGQLSPQKRRELACETAEQEVWSAPLGRNLELEYWRRPDPKSGIPLSTISVIQIAKNNHAGKVKGGKVIHERQLLRMTRIESPTANPVAVDYLGSPRELALVTRRVYHALAPQ